MVARLFLFAEIASLLVLAACASLVKIQALNRATLASPGGLTQAGGSPGAPAKQSTALAVGAVQAPICQASETCAALDAVQIPLPCVKKVPYTNVLVPVGTSFEVLDQSGDFMCLDTGVVLNDKEVLTCHGTELYSFQLRLTNTACSGTELSTGSGQCDDGYGYDAEQKCCVPVNSTSAGSTTVTVNLGACPLPNP